MIACAAPLDAHLLVDYWTADLDGAHADIVEQHLFACAECARRLEALAALAGAIASVARQGRLTGVISRAVLNRLQRDGVHVRYYTLRPGEVVPCAAYPGDDVVVTALEADLAGVLAASVTVRAESLSEVPVLSLDDVPIEPGQHQVLWITPASRIRDLPSGRVELTLRSSGEGGRLLGEYALEHTGTATETET